MLKVFKTGPHAHRTPLSYPALAPLFSDSVALVERPEQADLYVFAHSLDVQAMPEAVVQDWRRRRRPVVILSEEPFWDTIWGHKPLDRHRVLETRFGPVPVVQLNHYTSDIFDFDRIPYYLLTSHRFANTYAMHFARNAELTTLDWRRQFLARSVDLTFMFERRPGGHHAMRWPVGDIFGLCSWRTELAQACMQGTVERLGASWGEGPSRFALKDWHLDKITRLDNHARCIAAIENTHQCNYITEKLFDAFACGAVPAYVASRRHRISDLGLPGLSWINLFDKTPSEAADRLQQIQLDTTFFEAYAQAQADLADLFCAPSNWSAERARVGRAVQEALNNVLDEVQVAV